MTQVDASPPPPAVSGPVVVLAGGTGGAKFARGMLDVVGSDLVVVANTGDDVEIYGAYVAPDPDLCTFWLADLIDERGWGLAGDTFGVMDGLRDLGADVWFNLGDRDLAIGLRRAERLAAGGRLTETLGELGTALDVAARVLPMTDDPVRTRVRARDSWVPLQEFLIRERGAGPVQDVAFDGIEDAQVTAEVLDALANARAVILGPSNPVISIDPILGVPGMREALAETDAPVVAVSPVVGGAGPEGSDCRVPGLGGPYPGRGRCRRPLPWSPRWPRHRRDQPRPGPARAAHRHPDARRNRPRASRPRDPDLQLGPDGMSTIAVVPVKRFGDAKTRLAEHIGGSTRKALSEAMVTDVLIALRRSKSVDRVIVVTSEPAAEALANGYDAEPVLDDENTTHSAAAMIGVRSARERGARRVLLVPGDCPALDPKEVDALLASAGTPPEVLVVPDRHGTGTNALLLSPPDVMEPSFGPGSCARHLELARAAGVTGEVREVTSLGLDVDTMDDLQALRDALAGRIGGAAHTRGMLNRLARR